MPMRKRSHTNTWLHSCEKLLTGTHDLIMIRRIVPVHVHIAIVVAIDARHLAINITRAFLFLFVLVSENLPHPPKFSVSNLWYFNRRIKRNRQFLFLAN